MVANQQKKTMPAPNYICGEKNLYNAQKSLGGDNRVCGGKIVNPQKIAMSGSTGHGFRTIDDFLKEKQLPIDCLLIPFKIYHHALFINYSLFSAFPPARPIHRFSARFAGCILRLHLFSVSPIPLPMHREVLYNLRPIQPLFSLAHR